MKHVFKEKRRHIRVGALVSLSYTLVDKPKRRKTSLAKNIGGGGIKLPLKEKLIVGTLLRLELELIKEREKILLDARVVWIKSTPEDPNYPFEAGIEFINIDSSQRTMISNCVQYLNREGLLNELLD